MPIKLGFQLSKSGLLCGFNDYLPLGQELRGIVMPVVYVSSEKTSKLL